MRASGTSGELRFGYQQAAQLGAWTLAQAARVPRSYAFRATVVRTHPLWITQRPLDLVIALGQTEWRWNDAQVMFDGDECVIELQARPIVTERVSVLQAKGESQ